MYILTQQTWLYSKLLANIIQFSKYYNSHKPIRSRKNIY